MEQGIDLENVLITVDMSSSDNIHISSLSAGLERKETVADDNNNDTTVRTSVTENTESVTDAVDIDSIKTRYKVEYNLRKSSLVNRVETERRRKTPKEPKPKSKPPPLSKYRRRAANARERGRMLEINDAFDELASVIPVYEDRENKGKQTKITTLRLALNYIAALRETLGYPSHTSETGFSSSGEGSNSASESSTSDSASEGIQSPRSNLDSEGEQITQ